MKKILIIIGFVALSISGTHAQNLVVRAIGDMDSTVFVGIKDSLKPDIIIDGVKYDYKILDIIDQSKISSITVLKGEAAINTYNAPNGVIIITSKNESQNDSETKIRIRATGNADNKAPVIVIDGKVASQEELSKLSPSDVKSITVKKDENAKEQYNAPNGVIFIITK